MKYCVKLPEEPYTIFADHILHIKDSKPCSIKINHFSDQELYKSIVCPYSVKRLYGYNDGCIIKTVYDKYYITPNKCGSIIKILNKVYFSDTIHYVMIEVLDDRYIRHGLF